MGDALIIGGARMTARIQYIPCKLVIDFNENNIFWFGFTTCLKHLHQIDRIFAACVPGEKVWSSKVWSFECILNVNKCYWMSNFESFASRLVQVSEQDQWAWHVGYQTCSNNGMGCRLGKGYLCISCVFIIVRLCDQNYIVAHFL